MKVRAVDFIGIEVPDVAGAKRFYGEVLGLPITANGEGWGELEAQNVTIALYSPETFHPKSTGVALAVEDVKAVAEELRAKGVSVGEVSEYPPCYMAEVTDPFGNTLMLHQRKDGSAG